MVDEPLQTKGLSLGRVVRVAIGMVVQRLDEDLCVLLTRRHEHQVLGGYWEFPGGKVEPEETVEACVARELLEEVGVTVQVIQRLELVVHRYEHATVELNPVICQRQAGEPEALEVAEVAWVPVRSLEQYKFPPANGPVMASFLAALDSKPVKQIWR